MSGLLAYFCSRRRVPWRRSSTKVGIIHRGLSHGACRGVLRWASTGTAGGLMPRCVLAVG